MKKVQIGFTAKKNPSDEISEWQYDVISLPDDFTIETIKEELKERYWEVSNIRVFGSEELVPDKPRSDYVGVDTDKIYLTFGKVCNCDETEDDLDYTLEEFINLMEFPKCKSCCTDYFLVSSVVEFGGENRPRGTK